MKDKKNEDKRDVTRQMRTEFRFGKEKKEKKKERGRV